MYALWQKLVEALNTAGVNWCVLRDAPSESELDLPRHEVDLLVDAADSRQAAIALERAGCVPLRNWGHAPHRFFVAYDEATGSWLKLDIMTRLAFGRGLGIATSLAEECLTRRQVSGAGVPVLSPSCQLLTLLLHVLLDKDTIRSERQIELRELVDGDRDTDEEQALLRTLPGELELEAAVALIRQGQFSELEVFGRDLKTSWGGPLRQRVRVIWRKLLRRGHRWACLFSPDSPTVALLAPDGAGKSTLAQNLADSFYFPVSSIYMGLYQKASRRSVVGAGFLTRLVRQFGRYLRGRMHQGRGRLVVFDRHSYDSLIRSDRILRRGQRLRRAILGRACPPPDLVLLLDAPGALLYERKGEHTPERLEQQRQAYRELASKVPAMQIIDAAMDSTDVCRAATARIWDAYRERRRVGS